MSAAPQHSDGLLKFHAAIHPLPAQRQKGATIELRGIDVPTVKVPAGEAATLFPTTFDSLFAQIAAWPRFFCEPDGSFVGVSELDDSLPWQIDGQLFDGGPGMLYVELRGSCPVAVLDRLLAALGWPGTPVVFQLILEGVLLLDDDFRRVASR